MYKKYYSRFLNEHKNIQHYTAHSHHFWPDVTLEAMNEYWFMSSKYTDKKWNIILGEKVPQVQKKIASRIQFKNPENICFASSTHDLILRLISSLDFSKGKLKVLTTDSEFYSFERQIRLLQAAHLVEVTVLPTQPFSNLSDRVIAELKKTKYDLLFISYVFFNSGIVLENIHEIAEVTTQQKTTFVLDGYHAFMALPIDLSELGDHLFFIAGSYKYAQGGEGCCFMTIPQHYDKNPLISGWYSDFKNLDSKSEIISYGNNSYRFAGASMDYCALYRLDAVLSLFEKNMITDFEIHSYVKKLQNNFLDELEKLQHPHLSKKNIILHDLNSHGHFFAFQLPSIEVCKELQKDLEHKNILTDMRGSVLRFGFGIYQNERIQF